MLFPAIGAGAVLVVGGWAMLPRPRSTRLMSIFLVCLVILSLVTPWTVIRPAFAPPRLTSPANAAATVRGRELIYGNVARLLGVSVDRTSVAPEGRLKVRACWEALAPMEENYTVFVHLVGRDDTRVAERHTYPGLGRFPTSLWPVGQAFCDVYRIRVEDWAPAPELYDLVVGLYEASTGERLDVHDAEGNLVKFPTVAQVRVAPRPPLAKLPDDAHPLDYRLGERITLVGYRLSGTTLQSNAPLTVTLYWRANARPARNYTVFVHLVDETGRLLAQHDGPPRYGRYPTLAWQAGDVIPDQHVLMVPSLPLEQRGELRLVTGMYCSDTMERLPVADSNGALPEWLIPLPFSIP
ncbi:MAG: hypothetical protein DRI48_06235 [Chloroflexi bacterium]|nr:MAG: hypothetical protein DRI48_06235 [Chloroflexota bacterium]